MVAFSSLKHEPADQALEKSVEQALLHHDPFRFRRVMARARAGVVVLMGTVSSYYAKALSFNLAQRLPGVSGVIDAIAVALPLESRLLDEEDDF